MRRLRCFFKICTFQKDKSSEGKQCLYSIHNTHNSILFRCVFRLRLRCKLMSVQHGGHYFEKSRRDLINHLFHAEHQQDGTIEKNHLCHKHCKVNFRYLFNSNDYKNKWITVAETKIEYVTLCAQIISVFSYNMFLMKFSTLFPPI